MIPSSWKEVVRIVAKAAVLARTKRFRRALFRARVAAGVEHEPILKELSLRTVVDVGANKGQFALVALELFSQASVHAFEPLAAPAKRLMAWGRGEPRLTVRRVALAEKAGLARMHISARMDSSSLRRVTERQTTQFPGTHCVGIQSVPVARLDEVLSVSDVKGPALLKIDVQGGELDVLQGATRLLSCFDWIYVECSFAELYEGQALVGGVTDFLASMDFIAVVLWQTCRDTNGKPVQTDVLFARRPIFEAAGSCLEAVG